MRPILFYFVSDAQLTTQRNTDAIVGRPHKENQANMTAMHGHAEQGTPHLRDMAAL